MENKELLLKTAFCCMACDGEIAQDEIAIVKKMAAEFQLFCGLNVEEKLNEFVSQINQFGVTFLSDYIKELEETELTEDDELSIVKVAIATIEADNSIEYSEIKFFKKIREKLSVSDGKIEKQYPNRTDLDIYLLPDIKDNDSFDFHVSFAQITL